MRSGPPILRLSPFLPAPDAPRKRGRHRRGPHEAGTLDRIRTLVETTPLSFREIARQTGTSAATVSRHARAGAWVRPDPKPPLDHYTEEGRRKLRRRAFAERLMHQAERCVEHLESEPYPKMRDVMRALRLARAAAAFDVMDKPRRRVRRRKGEDGGKR